jgi:hypothetical protein
MRNRRVALIASTYLAAVVGIATAAALTISSTGATTTTKEAVWQHPIDPSSQRAMLLTPENLMPLAVYATAVEDNQAAQAFAQAEAAVAAANARATTRTAPSTGTTSPSTQSAEAPGAIWACIIQHESGGDPTAYNSSSGAAGLYQFELGTWLSPSIIAITGGYPGGASTAPASIQTAAAESYEAQNGWSAWRGDGCTPLG